MYSIFMSNELTNLSGIIKEWRSREVSGSKVRKSSNSHIGVIDGLYSVPYSLDVFVGVTHLVYKLQRSFAFGEGAGELTG